MADSKMAVCQWSPEFVQELPLVAQKTALLYHLSYLCLANFPNLETIIRARAVETQTLFESSEATMLKCIETSENLVTSLFPMLKKAVEQNKPTLEVHLIGKVRTWIKDLITDVNKIVEKYDLHNKDVASATSDVVQTKEETDKKIIEQDQELNAIQEALNTAISELQKTTAELAETENKIRSKTQEIQDFTKSASETSTGLAIFAAIVPFIGLIVKSIYDAVHDPKQVEQIKALDAQRNALIADKTALKQKQWQIQIQISDQQMRAARANFNRNSIPDPVHLNEVQRSLTKIQDILVQLRNFWESVAQMLDYLEQKTFVGGGLISDLAELKDVLLDSIKVAAEAWSCFGEGCKKASVIFKLQNKDAYKFLDVSTPSLCSCKWQIQYRSVKTQLEEIDPPPPPVTSPDTPAIAE